MESTHKNPRHVDVQDTMKKITMIRDNALLDAGIVETYRIWAQYFLSAADMSLSGLSIVNELIDNELPDHFDINIFMIYFDRLKKTYMQGVAIMREIA